MGYGYQIIFRNILGVGDFVLAPSDPNRVAAILFEPSGSSPTFRFGSYSNPDIALRIIIRAELGIVLRCDYQMSMCGSINVRQTGSSVYCMLLVSDDSFNGHSFGKQPGLGCLSSRIFRVSGPGLNQWQPIVAANQTREVITFCNDFTAGPVFIDTQPHANGTVAGLQLDQNLHLVLPYRLFGDVVREPWYSFRGIGNEGITVTESYRW